MLLLKLGLVILALYTLASLPSLRQISSPIFVFALLNASIFLLSLARISPPSDTKPTAHRIHTPSSESCVAAAPIGAEIEDDEFETNEAEMVGTAVADETQSVTADDISVVETEPHCEEEEEVVEELSNAEFNRIVEAFLEKQKRFHYQENISILV